MSVIVAYVRDTNGKPGRPTIIDLCTNRCERLELPNGNVCTRKYEEATGRLLDYRQTDLRASDSIVHSLLLTGSAVSWYTRGGSMLWHLEADHVIEYCRHGLKKDWVGNEPVRFPGLRIRGRPHGAHTLTERSWFWHGQPVTEHEFLDRLPVASQLVSVLPLSVAKRVVTFCSE